MILAAKQIERIAEPEVDVFLNDLERNATQIANVTALALLHELAGAADHSAQTRVTDEHVMSFFRQHKLTGAGQRLEARFGQGRKLILAVSIGKHGEHKNKPSSHG